MIVLPWLASALVSALIVGFFVTEWRRRTLLQRLATIERVADSLRDDVWRLEAASDARDRAEAASEAKSRFLATVSHEVRTPLNGILGMADLLKGLPLDREAVSYVEAIRVSGLALGSLIDEILDFSRIEAGRLELDDAAFDLHPLVEGVVELLAPRAQGKGLEIASLVGPGVPARLRGDPARLRQILINLAGNAIKFTDAGGVGLRVARDGQGLIHFTVEDTGIGIERDRQSLIFDEFEQGANPQGGAGLGLAISRRLAERMGGALVLVRSSPSGSIFDLALPLAAERSPALPQPTTRIRVLVVARSPFEAPFLAARLMAAGAQVVRAEGEGEALALFARDADFQAAIIDCALGEDAAARIAGAAHRAGVARTLVLLSPFERRTLAPGAWRAFDGWLVKPVRDASLHHCLDRSRDSFAMPAHTEAAYSSRLDGMKILVAEDNDINALILTRQLQRHGAEVAHVTDGARAIAAIREAREMKSAFDVAILDIRMPGLGGLEAVRRIRDAEHAQRSPRLPIIAVSASAYADDRSTAIEAGFDLFFVKPVELADLMAAVMQLTGRSSLQGPRTAAVMRS